MQKALYQVKVIDRGVPKSVGPKMIKDAAEQFCRAIEGQIRLGKEKQWSEPIVVKVN